MSLFSYIKYNNNNNNNNNNKTKDRWYGHQSERVLENDVAAIQ